MDDEIEVGRRVDALDKLARAYEKCERCPLSESRSRLVHWRGNPCAPLCIIGDAPGLVEEVTGRPFSGVVGRNLDSALYEAERTAEDVFIINLVACRPARNARPALVEVDACSPRLKAMLDIVKPKAILLLNNTVLASIWHGYVLDWTPNSRLGGERYKAVYGTHPGEMAKLGADSTTIIDRLVSDIELAWKIANGNQPEAIEA